MGVQTSEYVASAAGSLSPTTRLRALIRSTSRGVSLPALLQRAAQDVLAETEALSVTMTVVGLDQEAGASVSVGEPAAESADTDGPHQHVVTLRSRTDADAVIGSISVLLPVPAHTSDVVLKAEDRDFVDLVAAVVETAVLSEQQRRAELQREALKQTVYHVVLAASRELQLDDLLQSTVSALHVGVRSAGVRIRLFDADGSSEMWQYEACFPREHEGMEPAELLRIAGEAARVCWEQQDVGILQAGPPPTEWNVRGEQRVAALTNERDRRYMFGVMAFLGASCLLMAPLGSAGTCEGYITLYRTEPHDPFTSADAVAVMRIGQEVGAAVTRARLFAQQRDLLGKLEQASVEKAAFAATVVHQLRNPLTSIMGHAELLASEHVDSGSLQAIERNAAKLRATIDGLLTLSDQERIDRPVHRAIISLTDIVMDCATMLDAVATRSDVHLDVSGVGPEVMVWGDVVEVERVVDNVVGNALKYTPAGGTVALVVRCESEDAVFECRDDGPGISARDQLVIFDEFTRSSDERTLALPGAGLGLSIAKKIVDGYRGDIAVRSELGRGSLFRVVLPASGCDR